MGVVAMGRLRCADSLYLGQVACQACRDTRASSVHRSRKRGRPASFISRPPPRFSDCVQTIARAPGKVKLGLPGGGQDARGPIVHFSHPRSCISPIRDRVFLPSVVVASRQQQHPRAAPPGTETHSYRVFLPSAVVASRQQQRPRAAPPGIAPRSYRAFLPSVVVALTGHPPLDPPLTSAPLGLYLPPKK